MNKFDLVRYMWFRKSHPKIRKISGTPPLTFKSNGSPLKNYKIYGNTVNGESVGELVTEGEHAGEYKVPVTVSNGTDTQTTPIYLPEPIKMVGDEAEYIDYGEQKQHRVRKNLLISSISEIRNTGVEYTVNNDKSITANGSTSSIFSLALVKVYLTKGSYIISGCPQNGSQNTYRCEIRDKELSSLIQDTGTGVTYSIVTDGYYYYSIRIAQDYVCDNLTFYPMIRKADIEDDTYEPYIENTELDAVLPVLPTITGTNTLSVGTEVKPSKIEITGRIKMSGGE